MPMLLVLSIFSLALLVCICLTVYAFVRVKRTENKLEKLQNKNQQQTEQLSKRLDNYLTGSIQMGDQLYRLQQQLELIPERLEKIEHRDPTSISFTEAARLVGLGATSENLQQACGLSQAEADLLIRMQKNK